jgi:hypothetical protein
MRFNTHLSIASAGSVSEKLEPSVVDFRSNIPWELHCDTLEQNVVSLS